MQSESRKLSITRCNQCCNSFINFRRIIQSSITLRRRPTGGVYFCEAGEAPVEESGGEMRPEDAPEGARV